MWYCSALLMVLARRGFNGGHTTRFVAIWFVSTAGIWTLNFAFGAIDQYVTGDFGALGSH